MISGHNQSLSCDWVWVCPHPVPLPQPTLDDYATLVGGRGGPSFEWLHNRNLEGSLSRPPAQRSYTPLAAGEGRGEGKPKTTPPEPTESPNISPSSSARISNLLTIGR